MSYTGSGSITLASVFDGTDANGYSLETNRFEIFKDVAHKDGQDCLEVSPEVISCEAYYTNAQGRAPYLLYIKNSSQHQQNFRIRVIGMRPGQATQTFTDLLQLIGYESTIVQVNENQLTLNIQNLIDYIHTYNAPGSTFAQLEQLFLEAEPYFIFEIFSPQVDTDNYFLKDTVAVQLTNGTPNDLARFEVTARAINSAVGNSLMQFTEDGLRIIDGNFTISKRVKVNGTDIELVDYLVFDGDNLYVRGNGIFTGRIEAESGYFKGELQAGTGTIGGFIIERDKLTSVPHDGVIDLILNSNGSVEANNIILGDGATIKNYLKLGDNINNAYIYNPVYANNVNHIPYFLYLNDNNYLTSDGLFKINGITIDGVNSTISGSEDYNYFEITPGWAKFTNIEVAGKIMASVFAINQTQLVGGSILFKPSLKVKSIDRITANNTTTLILGFDNEEAQNIFTLNSTESSYEQYIIILDNQGRSIISLPVQPTPYTVLSSDDFHIAIENYTTDQDPYSCVIVGEAGDLNIGINSTTTNTNYMLARGLTVGTFDPAQPVNTFTSNVNLFLGDLQSVSSFLPQVGENQSYGYGLYSDNVFLQGSLTTQIGATGYAGINTLSMVPNNIFGNADSSNIVFWGGAQGTTDEAIQNAPFQVTANGSLYASNGKFTGSVIVDAEITGADIYTARIHGTGDDPALSLYGQNSSIGFYSGDGNSASFIYGISANGLYNIKNNLDNYFININSTTKEVIIQGDVVNGEIINVINPTSLQKIQLQNYEIRTMVEENNTILTKIDLNSLQNTVDFYSKSDSPSLSIGKTITQIYTPTTELTCNNVKLSYQQVAGGYNLYITD